jgi:hypothetical protein
MKKNLIAALLPILIISAGCANFNPRNQPRIDNDGKIEDMKTNQNGIMAEIGKLRQEVAIQNSKLKEIQNGLLNINAAVSRNENTGVQIIQGDGALIFIFALIVIAMLMFWYRDRAVKGEKTSEVLAKEIAKFNDPHLNECILQAALKENKGKQVYELIKKYIR